MPFADLIATWAAHWAGVYRVAVPPQLVQAVIEVESDYQPTAWRRESDGELSRGLMQVKESTARALGLADPQALFEPAVAIAYGTKYLAQQLAHYSGSIPRAVAAYNAGSARYTEQEEFVNQGYVDKVIAALRRIGRGGAVPLILGAAGLGAALLIARAFGAWRERGSALA